MSKLIEKHLKLVIDEIATEVGIKDYEIIKKIQEFTGDNYSGDIARIEIKSSDGTSLHLIMKTAVGGAELREKVPLVEFYKNETYTYTTVLPVLQKVLEKNGIPSTNIMRFAKHYKSITEELKEAIIMKDMCYDGYVLHNKREPFNKDQAETVIKTLAQLHAASFVMKEKDPKLYGELSKNLPHTNNYSEDLSHMPITVRMFTSQIECPIKRAKVCALGDIAAEKLVEILDSKFTEPYNVICHGDCWNNNMLFKYEEEKLVDVLLIDWQIIRIASPATDLCYLMFMSMDAEYLETHLEDLLDFYYSSLTDNLSTMGLDIEQSYPKEIFNKHVKRCMIFGGLMGLCGIPMILTEPKDAKKIEDMVNDLNNEVQSAPSPMSDLAKKRYNNIVNYLVDRGLM